MKLAKEKEKRFCGILKVIGQVKEVLKRGFAIHRVLERW